MKQTQPVVCLLLGPGGAGKTTASHLVAKKFKKSAVIEVDVLRHMIQSGYIAPFKKLGYEQLRLSTINASKIANSFLENGFSIIIDDCVTEKRRLDLYFAKLKKFRVVTILLLPHRDVITARDGQRIGSAKLGPRALVLHKKLSKRATEETRWHVIDNSTHTPQQTAKIIHTLLINPS